jgi:hypothetical protein
MQNTCEQASAVAVLRKVRPTATAADLEVLVEKNSSHFWSEGDMIFARAKDTNWRGKGRGMGR